MEEKIAITEEDKEELKGWFEQAYHQTFDTLPAFIQHVMNDYSHDYGTICHAIGACCIATAWACNSMDGARGGITGFQAGCIMWDFVRHWRYRSNKCGLRIMDYDNLLFPQYAHYFEKTIPSEVWECLQEEAKKMMEDSTFTSDEVYHHWESITEGNIPFGFTVEE